MDTEFDVGIVGSGPYALSLAAHLRSRGVEFRIFGPPMKFWRDMPEGINLKSFGFATSVYVPAKGHSFPEWCRANGLEDFEPCTMASFAAYGMAMQARFVPEIEPVEVKSVGVTGGGRFDLMLGNGERVRARRVVFATGLTHLESIPEALSHLPSELVSHTGQLTDYTEFRGKDVAVLGAGASAIEAGAMVRENGGHGQILIRERAAIFHPKMDPERPLSERLRRPLSVIGPGMKNRVLQAAPLAVYFLPERRRVRFVKGYLGPAAPWWIKHRVDGLVPILTCTSVSAAERIGRRVRLHLREEGRPSRSIDVDHVIAGTGYVPNVDRLKYLDEGIRTRLRRVELGPALSMHFESSLTGAYFVGPIAALSFGPLFRFVCGAEYAAPALARHLAGRGARMKTVFRGWGAGTRSEPDEAAAPSP